MRFFSLTCAILASYVYADMQGYNPSTFEAMSSIRKACDRDVDQLCPDPFTMLSNPRAFTFESPVDPILDLVMNPIALPPPLMDVDFMLDAMITQAMSFSTADPAPVIRTFHLVNVPFGDEGSETPEKILDSMVQTLVEKSPEEPAVLVEKIVQHGNDLLKMNHDDDFVRMARRLTQAEPDKPSMRPILPYGCPRNHCLMNALEEGVVSQSCVEAINHAEVIRLQAAGEEPWLQAARGEHWLQAARKEVQEVQQHEFSEEDTQVLVLSISYLLLAIMTGFLLRNRLKKLSDKMKVKTQTIHAIIQTVYSNPEIKAKIEKIVGKKFGSVSPLTENQNDGETSHACCFAAGLLKLVAFAFILTLIFTDPVLAMFALCVMMLARFIQLAFAACCDNDEDEEEEDCDSYNGDYGEYKPPLRHANEAVYEGIPIKIV